MTAAPDTTTEDRPWLRWLSPPLFLVIAACFLLPFLTVSCQGGGQTLDVLTYQGIDLAFGSEPALSDDVEQLQELGQGIPQATPAPELDPAQAAEDAPKVTDSRPFAIVALAAAVIGIGLGLLPRLIGPIAAAVAALIGVVATIVSQMQAKGQLRGLLAQEETPVQFFEFGDAMGYWLAIVLFAAAIAVQGARIVIANRRRGAAVGTTPSTAPPPPSTAPPPPGTAPPPPE